MSTKIIKWNNSHLDDEDYLEPDYYHGYENFDLGYISKKKSNNGKGNNDFDFNEILIARSLNLIPDMPPIQNQYSRGTCSTFATALIADLLIGNDPSEQYIYNKAWKKDNPSSSKSDGTSVKSVLDVIFRDGFPEELKWFYNPQKINKNPPQDPVPSNLGVLSKINDYKTNPIERNNLQISKICNELYKTKIPVITTVKVVQQTGWDKGIYIDVNPNAVNIDGNGHAIAICGYDLDSNFFLIRNSWGSKWGFSGYSLMSFSYLNEYGLDETYSFKKK